MLVRIAGICCLVASGTLARSLSLPKRLNPRLDPSSITGAPAALSTACGSIIADVDSPRGYRNFEAKRAYDCLQSVPFNAAVATRFLRYWNETIQFQSTLSYLKSPPQGYQQPAVDVLKELASIQNRINSGFYSNQYAFEADFQLLTYALHDGHVALTAGVLSAFSWGSPFEIVSVSVDGTEAPKVFFTADIIDSQIEGWKPSAVKTINGEDVVAFLKKFASLNSWGYVEPHAEWNALMSSPALDVQSGQTIFSGAATFYPGNNITVHFENYTAGDDTTLQETIWVATYNEVANYTGPLTTGGDFYDYFVLGNVPVSFDPKRILVPTYDEGAGEPEAAPGNWYEASFKAFPTKPDVAQSDLGPLGSGLVSGYFYRDISTGVLSLPSFDPIADTIGNYTDAVQDFIIGASKAGLDKIIIDLQRNSGGLAILPYMVFKLFFPDVVPSGGSRRRITPLASVLGKATTDFWGSLNETDPDELAFKQEMGAYDWLITNRLNAATGKNFSSWDDYARAASDGKDKFSQTEQYDLSNPIFDQAAFDQWIPIMYNQERKSEWPWTNRHWNPEHITILTDGVCASACALFVEMMTQMGVKTVVAGGRPEPGPMQAASGNRGASVYDAGQLDEDMAFARDIDEWVEDNVIAAVPEIREPGMFVLEASVNLRDQVRKDKSTPLQFLYQPADCRIYYTLANVYNFTRLWHDVAAAAAKDSLCVKGSTGFSTTNTTAKSSPPIPDTQVANLRQDNPVTEQFEVSFDPDDSLRDGIDTLQGTSRQTSVTYTLCGATQKENDLCNDERGVCKMRKYQCTSTSEVIPKLTCMPSCECSGSQCKCPKAGVCQKGLTKEQEKKESGRISGQSGKVETPVARGLCFPPKTLASLCAKKPKAKGKPKPKPTQ